MVKKLEAGEYQESEMTRQLAFKYLNEFSKKNNLQDDSSLLIVKAVEFLEKEEIIKSYWDRVKEKLSAKQLLMVLEGK